MAQELVVFGSFGFGNIGDEAVIPAIADTLQGRGIDSRIHVVSRFDNPAISEVVGLSGDYRLDMERLAHKPVILSGGGIIEPRANCCLLRFRTIQQTLDSPSISILAGSFEYDVEYSWSQKRRIRKALSGIDRVYTRDCLSEIFFRSHFPGITVATIGDVVLGLKAERRNSLAESGVADDQYIAVCLCQRWQNDPGWQEWIVGELIQLSNTYDKSLVFVAMSQHFDSDLSVHRSLAEHINRSAVKHSAYVIEQELNPRQIARVFKHAYVTVSMRLHGCVMSYAQKTPFVGLGYHPKLIGFALTVGWGAFLLPSGIDLKHDAGRYGRAFKRQRVKQNDLLKYCDNALSFGEFNLLPILQDRLGRTLEQIASANNVRQE